MAGCTISNDDDALRALLTSARTVAVVGLSDNPARPSNGVAAYLQHRGLRIVPVNPTIAQALGEPAYPDLGAIPFPVDIVDIFRRPDEAGAVVDAAIAIGAPAVWLQLGVVDEAAAQRAADAGLLVVMDRCIKVEYSRLVRG
jgi:predicted CoA-binding protein